jgi:hypothetical protein
MDDRSREGRIRRIPGWAQIGSVFVRAGHLLGCTVILGVHLAGVSREGLGVWWAAAGITGVVLVAFEWWLHIDQWRQVSGWVTVLKLGLLGGAKGWPAGATGLMVAAFVVSVFGARLPRRIRHRLLW